MKSKNKPTEEKVSKKDAEPIKDAPEVIVEATEEVPTVAAEEEATTEEIATTVVPDTADADTNEEATPTPTAEDFKWEEYWDIMSHSPKRRLVAKK